MLDAELCAILVCPVDHQALRDEENALVCTACGRRYPVIDGIPVMLPEQAESGEDTPAS
ncbi:MAG: Trm112 family protein [Armatimonadota bacterium]